MGQALDLERLMEGIRRFVDESHNLHNGEENDKEEEDCDEDKEKPTTTPAQYEAYANNKKLQIITVQELRNVLSTLEFNEVVSKIDEHPLTETYHNFAYHLELLQQFVPTSYFANNKNYKTSNYHDNVSNPELDNSINRKWKRVLSVRNTFRNNSSTRK